MQTNYNEVVVFQQRGDVFRKKNCEKSKHTHNGHRDVMENEETKRKMEVRVITLNYFAWP